MIPNSRFADYNIKETPFFSLLIPSYTRPNYLKMCIASILTSDFDDYEIIISDDYSSNIIEIQRVIKPFLKCDNISFIKQSQNLGMVKNWNFLVSKARGEYLIIFGDDDKLFPHTLNRLKHYIKRYPDFDIYGIGYNVIDENNQFCFSRCSPKPVEISLEYPELIGSLFVAGIIPFWLFHPFSICYKKEINKQIEYHEGALIGSDLLFLFDCVNIGKKIITIPEVLFNWRKMQNKNGEKYQNLSNIRGNNILARKKILDILVHQENLHSHISKLVSRHSFRKRFLYDSIVTERLITKDDIDCLNLSTEQLNELMKLWKSSNVLWHRLRIKLFQIYDYVRIFRFQGILRLISYGYCSFRLITKKIN